MTEISDIHEVLVHISGQDTHDIVECTLLTELITTLEIYYLSIKNDVRGGGRGRGGSRKKNCHTSYFFVPTLQITTVETVLTDIDNVIKNSSIPTEINNLHLQKILLQLSDYLSDSMFHTYVHINEHLSKRKLLLNSADYIQNITLKLFIRHLLEKWNSVKKIINRPKINCMRASDVPDQHISCFPIEILLEIRDAFNLKYPKQKIFDDNRQQIVDKLRKYTKLTTDDEFLTFLSEDKIKEYLHIYIAPRHINKGNYIFQFDEVLLAYEKKYSDYVYISYQYMPIPSIMYNTKYKKEVEVFIRERTNPEYHDKLLEMFEKKDNYDHTSLFLVILFMLRQKNINQISILIGCENHATCVYINKNDKEQKYHMMHYNSNGDDDFTHLTELLRDDLRTFISKIYENIEIHTSKQHQFNNNKLCLIFSVTFAIHMLNPNILLVDKFAHFEKKENRNDEMVREKLLLLNKNIPYMKTHFSYDNDDYGNDDGTTTITKELQIRQRDLKNDTIYFVQSKNNDDITTDDYYLCNFFESDTKKMLQTYEFTSAAKNFRFFAQNPLGDTKENIETKNNIIIN
jgi:hypothetical protein